jgi:hypothetical protein
MSTQFKTTYKASAYWTATKTFKPAYEKVNTDFVLDTTLQMAGPERFELPTSSFEDWHSIQLS